jgi:hypothetical protein
VIGRLPETGPDASRITASPTSIPVEGDSTSRITVQLKDAIGNITTGATVALNSTLPSMDSDRPSRGLHVVSHRHMGVQIGILGRESRCVSAAATRPATLTCQWAFSNLDPD